jgi:tetratricopeptide (TPR) repeat protein
MAPAGAADLEAGVTAARKGDYATALREWRPLAEAGNPHAQFNLGLLYENGLGMPADAAEAARWYRRAADQDDRQAQAYLAEMYAQGLGIARDDVEALRWYRRAAQRGDTALAIQRGPVLRDRPRHRAERRAGGGLAHGGARERRAAHRAARHADPAHVGGKPARGERLVEDVRRQCRVALMRYARTLGLVAALPARRPAPTLPSRLDELFEKLSACPDAAACRAARRRDLERLDVPRARGGRGALERAAADMAAGRFDLAETRLAILVRRRPDWAEAWNKQATLHYLRGRDDATVAAIHRTLELEPRHFGALASLGEILRAQGELETARLAFGCALQAVPAARGRAALGGRAAARGVSAEAREQQLREDRRLLGRLLGDVVREQAGAATFDTVERIRQAAVGFHRAEADRAGLEAQLNALDIEQTLHVVRAFSYFSLLLNIAEDAHQRRQDPGGPGTFAHALARARQAGATDAALAAWFAHARVSPVLTAHPTEVQRQSILDCERGIARLIAQPPGEARDAALEREVLRLWLTSMLRLTRLEVADEIANGLAYFRLAFFEELPRLYAALEAALGARRLPSFLWIGTWIGGDRDGNPNVGAATLELALAQQARLAFEHYLHEVNELGRELPVSTRIRAAPPEIEAAAAASGDDSPYRSDEPYRRIVSGIYARLAATARSLCGLEAVPAPSVERPAYAGPAELEAELELIERGLESQGAERLAAGRLRALRRKVGVFGFHLARIDLRQSSGEHEAVVAELLARAGVASDYAALDESGRVALLARELAGPRLVRSPHLAYSPLVESELAVAAAAAAGRRRLGPQAVPHYVISHCRSLSDLLEVGVLLREAGLLRPGERPRSRWTSCRFSSPSPTSSAAAP